MNDLPLYRHAGPALAAPDTHKGLWFERFFDRYGAAAQWTIPELVGENSQSPKAEWIGTLPGSCGDTLALQTAALERIHLVEALAGDLRCYCTDWHFVTGLGLPHPVENGFAWHPTLGVPYLSGAVTKGLVRAFVEAWEPLPDNTRRRWFGTEEKADIPEQAGTFIFFDALPVEPPRLASDIITPHMGRWYEDGDKYPLDPAVTPADWHDPLPVPFLVVESATFLFGAAVRPGQASDIRDQSQQELSQLMEVLEKALDWLGAGAKTAVGYGRMVSADKALAVLRQKAMEGPLVSRWIDDRLADIVSRQRSRQREALIGEALAKAWSELKEPFKAAVLIAIRARWENSGESWAEPRGKAARKARVIYGQPDQEVG